VGFWVCFEKNEDGRELEMMIHGKKSGEGSGIM